MDYYSMREINFKGKLSDAVQSGLILPGSRLLLRDGVHYGDIVNTLTNVTIEPYPGEHAVIDGAVTINGSDVTIKNMEIQYLGWTDRLTKGKAMNLNAPRLKLINCDIHNMEIVGFWESAVDAELYGCVIRNTGRMEKTTGYGHSLYIQNGNGRKIVKHNIFLSPFNWNVHAYAEGGKIDNISFIENISILSGVLAGIPRDNYLIGGTDAHGIVMDGNLSWGGRWGYYNFGNTATVEMSAKNNYFPDNWNIDRTTLSENINNVTGVIGDHVFLFPNEYNTQRANLAIYNEKSSKTVNVDLSPLGWSGSVQVRNAQDYHNDIQKTKIVDGIVSIDMMNRTVEAPAKWTPPASTFPQFGCFVLEAL